MLGWRPLPERLRKSSYGSSSAALSHMEGVHHDFRMFPKDLSESVASRALDDRFHQHRSLKIGDFDRQLYPRHRSPNRCRPGGQARPTASAHDDRLSSTLCCPSPRQPVRRPCSVSEQPGRAAERAQPAYSGHWRSSRRLAGVPRLRSFSDAPRNSDYEGSGRTSATSICKAGN